VVRSDNGLYERRRTPAIGEWTTVSYSAGDYTCNGGDTWTVDSGDVTTFQYMRLGDTLFVDLTLDTTSITGGTATQLSVKVPAALTVTKTVATPCTIFNNTTSAFETGSAQVVASGTTINIQRAAGVAFSISTNNTFIRAALRFKAT
jgi:hypothetical protein